MTNLENKSIHELRGIAQTMGIGGIFEMNQAQLLQAIQLRDNAYQSLPNTDIGGLNTNNAGKALDPNFNILADYSSIDDHPIAKALAPYARRGLHVRINADHWHIKYADAEDTGSLTMPIRDIVGCAEKIMRNERANR